MEKIHERIGEQQANQAFATSDFYQLLSLSVQWPGREFGEALLDGSYQNDATDILKELGCEQSEILEIEDMLKTLKNSVADKKKFLIELAREYTRLFNHPEKPVINIYESMFLHESDKNVAMFINPVALDVERCYKEAGVYLQNASKEPADHMAAELEFMMYLYANKGLALKEQNREKLSQIEENIDEFEKLHFSKWAVPFFSLLGEESEILAYKVVAKVAKTGLREVLAPDC